MTGLHSRSMAKRVRQQRPARIALEETAAAQLTGVLLGAGAADGRATRNRYRCGRCSIAYHLPASVRVYICRRPVTCERASMGSMHWCETELDPLAGHLPVFARRRRDRIRIFLGSCRIRTVEYALGRGHLRTTIRLWRLGA